MNAPVAPLPDGLVLHGHGEEPASLAAAAQRLHRQLGLVLVRPAAPLALSSTGSGRAWWEDTEEGPGDTTLHMLLEQLGPVPTVDHPGPVARAGVLIAGFSQGGAVAASLATALVRAGVSTPLRLVVVAGFSPEPLPLPPAPDDSDLRALVLSGSDDSVVDPFHGELLARRLRRGGWTVEERSHDGGHYWDGLVTDMVSGWLRAADPGMLRAR